MLIINASRVDSHLLIGKRPLGTWILFINVFRVVFTLVDKKTTSWDWCILINASRVDSHLLIRKRPLGTLDTSINVFRDVFTLVDKKTTSWDLYNIYQCI